MVVRSSAAYERDLQVSQYQHAAWLSRNGAPVGIRAIAQTDDGTLWLGAEDGLYRFDGESFELVPTPGGTTPGKSYVSQLVAEPGGGLWVGFRRNDGIGYLKDGKFSRVPGTLHHNLEFMARDGHGALWARLDYALYRVKDMTLQAIGAAWNAPATAYTLVLDAHDTLWVADTESHVFRLSSGQTRFVTYPDRFPVSEFVADARGVLWGSGKEGTWTFEDHGGQAATLRHSGPGNFFGTMLFDREGGLWLQREHGLSREADPGVTLDERVNRQPASKVFSSQQGLSSETIYAMFEDRDGNVWTGTSKGLDRFRRTRLTPVALPGRALSFAVAPAGGGAVWAANWAGTLMKVGDGTVQDFPGVGPGTKFIRTSTTGDTWLGGALGLWHSRDGAAFDRVPVTPAYLGDGLRDVAGDGAGGFWVAGGSKGSLAHVTNGVWTPASPSDGFPAKGGPRCLVHDAQHRSIWACGGVDAYRIVDGKARWLSTIASGLDVGIITVIQPHGERVWFGGYTGVALFDGRRVVNLRRKDGRPFGEVGGVVELAGGDVWLHNRTTVIRVPGAEVQALLAGTGTAVDVETFDETDGLYGILSATSPLPSVIQADDGRLWFPSDAGLAWLDPARTERKIPPPPLRVRSLVADGTAYELAAEPRLAPRNRRVEFAWSAIALSMPERVKFRYRLDGIDSDWREAGPRRAADFNSLPPGYYVFRVTSTDEYGRWNGQEAAVRFMVQEAWFQTTWFRMGCGIAFILMLWTLFRLRERQVTRQVMAREEARQVERNRIARDLHDSFLQSVQGLMWQFQALLARIPAEDPLRDQLDRTLVLANSVVGEGRDRVKGLREGGTGRRPLSDELRAAWVDSCGGDPDRLEIAIEGEPRPLSAQRQREVFHILREALANAHAHAQASRVRLALVYGVDRFAATVEDDGVGLPDDVSTGGRPGHWGLVGMRERAAEIGGSLSIRAVKDGGTAVELRLEARDLYAA